MKDASFIVITSFYIFFFTLLIAGVFSGLKKIFQREHFLGLYKGNGAQMIRVFPYAAVQFATFENYKRVNTIVKTRLKCDLVI